jgi:hypothetical protein
MDWLVIVYIIGCLILAAISGYKGWTKRSATFAFVPALIAAWPMLMFAALCTAPLYAAHLVGQWLAKRGDEG